MPEWMKTFEVRTGPTGLCSLLDTQQGAIQEHRRQQVDASAPESLPSSCTTPPWFRPLCCVLLQGAILPARLGEASLLQKALLSAWSSLQSCPQKGCLTHTGVASL